MNNRITGKYLKGVINNYNSNYGMKCGVSLIDVEYNGYHHLKKIASGNNIFTGNAHECVDFINGLQNFINEMKF